jgi:hypothetical protein
MEVSSSSFDVLKEFFINAYMEHHFYTPGTNTPYKTERIKYVWVGDNNRYYLSEFVPQPEREALLRGKRVVGSNGVQSNVYWVDNATLSADTLDDLVRAYIDRVLIDSEHKETEIDIDIDLDAVEKYSNSEPSIGRLNSLLKAYGLPFHLCNLRKRRNRNYFDVTVNDKSDNSLYFLRQVISNCRNCERTAFDILFALFQKANENNVYNNLRSLLGQTDSGFSSTAMNFIKQKNVFFHIKRYKENFVHMTYEQKRVFRALSEIQLQHDCGFEDKCLYFTLGGRIMPLDSLNLGILDRIRFGNPDLVDSHKAMVEKDILDHKSEISNWFDDFHQKIA